MPFLSGRQQTAPVLVFTLHFPFCCSGVSPAVVGVLPGQRSSASVRCCRATALRLLLHGWDHRVHRKLSYSPFCLCAVVPTVQIDTPPRAAAGGVTGGGGTASKVMPCIFLSNLVVQGVAVHKTKHLSPRQKPEHSTREIQAYVKERAVRHDGLRGT